MGERWTMPQSDKIYSAYVCSPKTFAVHGGIIYNASRQTALDVFTRRQP